MYDLLDKYLTWAKFDWCYITISRTGKLKFYDLEEHKYRSLSYILRCILDNGMLDECYTNDEIITLMHFAPPRFVKEISLYLKEN